MVEEGQEAPDLELASDSGERVRLSRFRGRPVVLYFYPRDDSRGRRPKSHDGLAPRVHR
jgi:thioredoxin-dependent peroxiredoxin